MFIHYTLHTRSGRLSVLGVFIEEVKEPSHRFLIVVMLLTFDDDLETDDSDQG